MRVTLSLWEGTNRAAVPEGATPDSAPESFSQGSAICSLAGVLAHPLQFLLYELYDMRSNDRNAVPNSLVDTMHRHR